MSDNGEAYWRDKKLKNMSKDELINALAQTGRMYQNLLQTREHELSTLTALRNRRMDYENR